MWLPVFHLSVIALNVYACTYDQLYLDIPFPSKVFDDMPFKARYMFLTIWCFMLQTLYFCVSFLNDIIGTNEVAPKRTPLIRNIKDILFSVAFPIALYVSVAFWGIYAIDKPLVFPEMLEKIFPAWLNHTMHTFITVFLIIELLVTKRNYPSRITGSTITIVFVVSYIIWMHVLHARTGAWPYPIFDVLNLPMRFVFCGFSTILGLGIYIVGEKLNSIVSPISKQYYSNGTSKKSKLK
ncbi:androgen-dependent TFPI-regulating protein-like [Galleria mellonella]|uniref:Androgen-dependent TFPI-regulating protein-like n=1 Tax=Galleria mellonella TaxID=7137 RepID=A0A6J1WQB7_GALME|nr:androgen-dependent TFPI-regulating protein-like [Galleria mellonella]